MYFDWMSVVVLLVRQSGVLGDELIESHEGDCVATRHIFDGILPPSHTEHCTLDILDGQVFFLPWNEVGSHDTHLQSTMIL